MRRKGSRCGCGCADYPLLQDWKRWEDAETGTEVWLAPKDRAPAPIAWEACEPSTLNAPCTREATLAPSTHTHVFGASIDLSRPGSLVGVFGRRCPAWDFILLAELQGRVLTAIAQRGPEQHRVQVRDVAQGRWVATTRGRGAHSVFGGEVGLADARTITSLHEQSDVIRVSASGDYVVVQDRELLRWSGESLPVPWQAGTLPSPTLWGLYALYTRWSDGRQDVVSWDPVGGERVAARLKGMTVQSMATDGMDLALVARAGTREVLSLAAFRGEASAPRKLAELKASHGSPVVGCGMVALRNGSQEVSVIRVSDGHAWTLHAQQACSLWCLDPLALTCDELVAEMYGSPWSMLRVRLDEIQKVK